MESTTTQKVSWALDPSHSEVQFKVKHMVISTVTGSIKKFNTTLKTDDEDISTAQISFEGDVDSISTDSEQRDQHLKSDDFFNVAQFPKITFVSTGIKKIDGANYEVTGNLTIRDVTKSIALQAEYGGSNIDFYGNKKIGFEVTGKISRKDFNLKWNGITEAGAIVVGDEVKFTCNIQFSKSN